MLAAHPFEERQPCPEEAGVAFHAVEWKRPKLLPALRAALGGERLAASARVSGGDAAGSALGAGPKARAIAAGTLGTLMAEAPDKLGGVDGRHLRYSNGVGHWSHHLLWSWPRSVPPRSLRGLSSLPL